MHFEYFNVTFIFTIVIIFIIFNAIVAIIIIVNYYVYKTHINISNSNFIIVSYNISDFKK